MLTPELFNWDFFYFFCIALRTCPKILQQSPVWIHVIRKGQLVGSGGQKISGCGCPSDEVIYGAAPIFRTGSMFGGWEALWRKGMEKEKTQTIRCDDINPIDSSETKSSNSPSAVTGATGSPG